jgi:methionine aminopeptidase
MNTELIEDTTRYLLTQSSLAKYVAEYIREEWDRGMSIDNIEDIVENALKAYYGGAR